MDKFTKMASPLALVAGMAGFGLSGTALASGPGDYANNNWITPPIVQSTQDAVQWDDLSAGAPVETVQQYEYLPPANTTAEAVTPLATPTTEYAETPVTSATTQSYVPPARRHHTPSPCAAKTVMGPCGVAPHPHPHQRPYAAPTFFAPQAPVYRQPAAPVYYPPVPQVRDRIVEKKVFVDRPIERKVYVNRPIYIDRPVYVPKRVNVPTPVAVPVDRPVYVERRVAVPTPVAVPVDRPVYVERRVAVPVDRPIPVPVDRPVYVEKRVAVPTPVAVPVDRPVYIDRPVQTPVYAPTPQVPNYGTCAIAQPQLPTGCYGGYGASSYGTSPYGASPYGASPAHATTGGFAAPALNTGFGYGSGATSFGGTFGNSLGGFGHQGGTASFGSAIGGLGGFGAVGGFAAQDCCSGFTGGVAHQGGHSDHAFRSISDRIAKISARIADGENAGMITAIEAANLRKKIQSVSKDLTSARKDGRFEEKEIEVVAASVRQLADQMKVAKQNEEMVERFAQGYGQGFGAQQFGAQPFGGQAAFGGYGMTPASFRPQFGAAGAFLPGAQYPGLQQALPFAYGGFGGMAPSLGQY